MRLILNLLMKEITLAVYSKGLFGEEPELDVNIKCLKKLLQATGFQALEQL